MTVPVPAGNHPVSAVVTSPGKAIIAAQVSLASGRANMNNVTGTLPVANGGTGATTLGSGLSVDGDALNLGPLTESGSGASVETDGCGIFGVQGEGYAEQNTTTGKNLLPNNLVDATVSGVTFTKLPDGGIKVYGTETGSNGGTSIAHNLMLEPGKYTISMGGSFVGNLRLYAHSPSTNTLYASFGHGTHTFTVQSQDTINVYFSSSGSNYQLEDTVIYPQLEAGSTATDYEPYTGGEPSPSPDYPQEIKVARGRNLFSSILANTSLSHNGTTGTVASNSNCYTYVGEVQPNTTYTISSSTGNRMVVCESDTATPSVGTALTELAYDSSNPKTKTFTSGTKKYVIAYISNAGAVSDAQLELGSTPSPYVPYGHIGLEVTSGKNLVDWDSAWATVKSGEVYRGLASYFFTTHIAIPQELIGQRLNFSAYIKSVNTTSNARVAAMVNGSEVTPITGIPAGGEGWTSVSFVPATANDYLYITYGSIPNGTLEISKPQLELGSQRTDYEPEKTVTPIPLPAKGFAGALPDGTADALTLDSAGRWEWVNETGAFGIADASGKIYGGSTGDSGWGGASTCGFYVYPVQFTENMGIIPNGINVRCSHLLPQYPIYNVDEQRIATNAAAAVAVASRYVAFRVPRTLLSAYGSTNASESENIAAFLAWGTAENVRTLYRVESSTEHGYIALPELPNGATVSIPELEAIGVEWWVEGAEAIAEHGRDVSKANKEQEDRIAELEAAVANMG